MSYDKKVLEIIITLGEGDFGADVGSSIKLVNHRAMVNISAFGGESQGQLQCRIYGLPISTINQLTVIGPTRNQIRLKNQITILAGTGDNAPSVIYTGNIWEAYGDFSAVPDAALNVIAYSALSTSLAPIDHTAVPVATPTNDVMTAIANKAKLKLVSYNVTGIMNPTYFDGFAKKQINDASIEGNFSYAIERGELHIWPKTAFRGDDIASISPGNGLIGYPSFSSDGVSVRTDFLPFARVGGRVKISGSAITPANGTWVTYTAIHDLSSQMPGGPWFTSLDLWYRDK